jgi:trimethylamine:corrinoid methyltransferase-like protein
MMGGTTPATLGGGFALGNTEVLSSLVMTGSPRVRTGSESDFERRRFV